MKLYALKSLSGPFCADIVINSARSDIQLYVNNGNVRYVYMSAESLVLYKLTYDMPPGFVHMACEDFKEDVPGYAGLFPVVKHTISGSSNYLYISYMLYKAEAEMCHSKIRIGF